ncbi:MAG: hydroxymethylbilane synthase [SAR202 cluster bacterium]|nr:MAG: hydroxymethylbilane synthase [SAR202 cluster bacterium]
MTNQNDRPIKVGTRGSNLALTQTGHVIDALSQANPSIDFEIVTIKTTGDHDRWKTQMPLKVGVFVRELEAALLDNRIDIAVHSLKDMPSSITSELVIAAVPEREDPRDALISRKGIPLEDLPAGSRIATGSIRRQALVKSMRPDLTVEPVRGNVETRLEKLRQTDGPDAVILATAGLNRLGLQDQISQHLSCMKFVAAVGQGALAVETRADDNFTTNLAAKIDHIETRQAITAERAFLQVIGGGCSSSVSAHAKITKQQIEISAFASTQDASTVLREQVTGMASDAANIGVSLGESFVAQGVRQLLSEDPV